MNLLSCTSWRVDELFVSKNLSLKLLMSDVHKVLVVSDLKIMCAEIFDWKATDVYLCIAMVIG